MRTLTHYLSPIAIGPRLKWYWWVMIVWCSIAFIIMFVGFLGKLIFGPTPPPPKEFEVRVAAIDPSARAAQTEEADRYIRSVAERTKEHEPGRGQRSVPSEPPVTASPVASPVAPPSPNVTLACIREHESHGDYTIVNSGGYAGAYQMSPEYSDDWARAAGYPQWANQPANYWPVAVQDAVALHTGTINHWHTWSDWGGYYCPGF